ncbi:MAG: RagB/SusD family nutrient uptake outer membrane protein [Tannerella sp.]|jgi:tetratricopeptide (TPR) repeat protein|nr:RagB/SusD family nutrient uptake outer membrane protein [Tannerella sp.]
MKRFIYISNILFILLTTTIFTSCVDDFLDKEPYGTSSFWTTPAEAELGINAAYQPFYEEEFYGRGQFWLETADDDMIVNNSGKTTTINLTSFISTTNDDGYSRSYWEYSYRIIRRSNDVLRNVPNMSMDQNLKNRILGEANFMLGLTYFQLARRHGGLPFGDKENPLDYNKPRETLTETYNRIEAYLLEATHLLTEWNSNNGENAGRATLGAAWGTLAKVYCYWGKYDKAKDACEKVINSGQFDLLDDYAKAFSLEYEKSPEHIFYVNNKAERHHGTITSIVHLSQKLTDGGGWKYFAPTKSLSDAFEPEDTRRSVTLAGIRETVRLLNTDVLLTADNISDMGTGFMCMKYASPYQKLSSYDWETGLDIPILRYSDILLLHAEAIIVLGGGGPDPGKRNTGVAAAAESFNKVRLRAFKQDQSKYIAAPTFMDLVNERRCELAFEEQRHADLVRWGLAKEVYAAATTATDPRGPRTFDPAKHNYFMLPQREIDISNGLLINNPEPGYSTFE